jgi:hypothetical protein
MRRDTITPPWEESGEVEFEIREAEEEPLPSGPPSETPDMSQEDTNNNEKMHLLMRW